MDTTRLWCASLISALIILTLVSPVIATPVVQVSASLTARPGAPTSQLSPSPTPPTTPTAGTSASVTLAPTLARSPIPTLTIEDLPSGYDEVFISLGDVPFGPVVGQMVMDSFVRREPGPGPEFILNVGMRGSEFEFLSLLPEAQTGLHNALADGLLGAADRFIGMREALLAGRPQPAETLRSDRQPVEPPVVQVGAWMVVMDNYRYQRGEHEGDGAIATLSRGDIITILMVESTDGRASEGLVQYALILDTRIGQATEPSQAPGQTRRSTNLGSTAEAARSASLVDRLAFVSERDGNTEVYVVNADGSGLKNLSNHPARDCCPLWSPDGTRFAFSETGDRPEVYIIDTEGARLANLPAFGIAWSPDGTRVVLTSEDFEIYVMNTDGARLRNVSQNPQRDWAPVWSHDSTQVAFNARRGGDFEIYVVDVDREVVRNLTNRTGPNWDPVWSPSGPEIVFVSERDGNPEIYLVNADGTGLRRLTENLGMDIRPVWSPDGRRIAFESDRDGNFEIYLVNADGSDLRNLTNHPSNDRWPSWSPSGTRVAFTSDRDGNSEIYVMNADGTAVANLTNHPGQDCCSVWSPR
jgi:Tol biopolymer transport system component